MAWKESHLSTLTKIAIVVLVVLVLLATPIFIQQASVPANWRLAYTQQGERLRIAEANAANQQTANEVMRQNNQDLLAKYNNLAQTSQSDAEKSRIQLAEAQQLLAVRASEMQTLSANYAGLEAELRKAVAFNQSQANDLKQVQKDMGDAQDQLRQARDKIQEDATQIDLLTQSQRVSAAQLSEKDTEMADQKREMERVRAGGPAAAPVAAAKPAGTAGPRIEGSITAIKGDTASLNIGAASGVKPGMEFIIYRGPDFVAHLQVSLVNASTSAGVIVDAQRDVKQGDKATTKLETE